MQNLFPRIRNWISIFKNFPRKVNIVPTHREYQKFIILGRSRTGSNFVRGLLNNHSQITIFGEIFGNYKSIDFAMPEYHASKHDLQIYQTDPTKFLETKVFSSYPKNIKAVGFKIFYYHAQIDPWEMVWPHLQTKPDLKIIHIKRKNILRTHLSRKRAAITDQWVNTTGNKNREVAVHLDYKTLLEDFEQTREWEVEFDKRFAHQMMFEVYYEDLARDYLPLIQKMQSFLGVDPQPVLPQTYKQAQLRLAQSIENYEDLLEKFKNSPWEIFFKE